MKDATNHARRALLWIDHHEARLVPPEAHATDVAPRVIAGDDDRPHERRHGGGHRHPISVRYADRVAAALRDQADLVLAGPSSAKDELYVHLRERHPELAERVSLVKTLDRDTDPRLAAVARTVFERLDRMRGIHVPQAPYARTVRR